MERNYQKDIIEQAKSTRKGNRIRVLIGDRIKHLRLEKRYKLKDLSLESGVQIATLSRIEHGIMSGSIESHAQIAKVFRMELHELYKGVKVKPVKKK